MTARLSIGLPVFNGARYVATSIESLLSQDFTDFELIISDNCSTDDSARIAAAFAERDSRVRLVRQERNLGAAANFNAVFHLGTARYFKWACADDCLRPGFLAKAIAELDAHPEAVACYGQVTLIDADGSSIGDDPQRLDLRQVDPETRFQIARRHTGLLNVLQGVMRTKALRTTALMRSFPGSDEALVVELALRGAIHEIQEPWLLRRLHAEAASAGTTADRFEHLDPRRRDGIYLSRWSKSIVSLRAAVEAPLSLRKRAGVAGIVMRGMIAERDTLIAELFSASGQLINRVASHVRTVQPHRK